MIMEIEYLDELKDRIHETPESVFASQGLTSNEILSDKDTMERLWAMYQKSIEDYDVDPDYAYRDALWDILQIPMDLA